MRVSARTSALRGRRILVTRAPAQAAGLLDGLRRHGAEVVAVPLIEIERLVDDGTVRAGLDRLAAHGGARAAVFSSANAVRLVAEAVEGAELARWLRGAVVAAVGPETARALAHEGVQVDVIPQTSDAGSLAGVMAGAAAAAGPQRSWLSGARVWMVSAEGARDVLRARMAEAGATVDMLTLYRSVLPEGAGERLLREARLGLDAVTLTSGRAAEHLVLALGGTPLPETATVACIGPVTAAAARRLGLPVGPVAAEATAARLVEAVVDHFQRPLL